MIAINWGKGQSSIVLDVDKHATIWFTESEGFSFHIKPSYSFGVFS